MLLIARSRAATDQALQEALAERQQRLSIYKDALAMPAVLQEFRQATAIWSSHLLLSSPEHVNLPESNPT